VLGVSPDKVKMSASDKEINVLQKELDQLTAKAESLMKKIQKLKN
jgi:cell division protein FtsB